MSSMPPDHDNPYAAPTTDIKGPVGELPGDLTHAEQVRREYLGHEASVKSVGSLYYLGAFFGIIGVVGILATIFNPNVMGPAGPQGVNERAFMVGISVFYLLMTALNIALGYGLHHLQTWARWTVAVLTGLSLLYVLGVGVVTGVLMGQFVVGAIVLLVGGGISGYILYLMVSPRASVVFSREYKQIILKTPHIRYKTSLLLKIVLVVFILLIVSIVGYAVFLSALGGR